jgi:tRNA(Ile)-lysidine synthase
MVDELWLAADNPPRLLVAFSGGPDSTALLWGLSRVRESRELNLIAAHLDHALDESSSHRARHAVALATRLDVECHAERRAVRSLKWPGESIESAARRIRYGFLEEVAARQQAHWILTAHHRDDQAETVLMRILFGSGWQGLAAVADSHGRILRPLLRLPASELRSAVERAGLEPNLDPTNEDLEHPRNRIRHRLLPELESRVPDVRPRLAALARRVRSIRERLDNQLAHHLELQQHAHGVAVSHARLRRLPREIRRSAYAVMARRCERPLPPSGASLAELERQLIGGEAVRVDCGEGWCWNLRGGRLHLERARPEMRDFQYTVRVPGELEIPEVGLRMRLRRATLEPWMKQGRRSRAALNLPLRPGDRLTVRNRRAGDRLRPLGAPGRRRLKKVLIDRKMPRLDRDLLPLLLWQDRIAWVPGVTIDEAFRLRPGAPIWIAELEPNGISPAADLLDEQTD